MPMPKQALRQPSRSMMCCTTGSMMIEPTPTPAKAMLSARPRQRTNQFGRNND
jgi:hypothetical protein